MGHAVAAQKVLGGVQEGGECLWIVLNAQTAKMTDALLALLLGKRIDLCGDSSNIPAVASCQPEANFRTAQEWIGFWREGFLALHEQRRAPRLVVFENGEWNANEALQHCLVGHRNDLNRHRRVSRQD